MTKENMGECIARQDIQKVKRGTRKTKIIKSGRGIRSRVNGSFTIEAAVVVPMFLFLFVIVISCGVEMYTECRDMAVEIQQEKELDTVTLFYRYQMIGDMVEDGD